jgi:hypothetical protein
MGRSSSPSFSQRVPARLWALLRRENAARVSLQTKGPDLRTIGLGIETETAGDRQAGLPHARQIGSLGPEAPGVRGLAGAERKHK